MTQRIASGRRSIVGFFVLTFVYTIPTYVLIGLTSKGIILSPEMVFSFIPLSLFAPIGAAITLSYRNRGKKGVKKLLKRTFDYKRIKNRRWLAGSFLATPLLFLLVWGVSLILDKELVPPMASVLVSPIMFLMFCFGAHGEETGWMGYVFKPMERKWSTLKATLILAVYWAIWHVPIYVFAIEDPVWIVAQTASLIAFRYIIVWLYNNTGKSVFVTILLHAIYNTCMAIFPVNLVGVSITISIIAINLMMFENVLRRSERRTS